MGPTSSQWQARDGRVVLILVQKWSLLILSWKVAVSASLPHVWSAPPDALELSNLPHDDLHAAAERTADPAGRIGKQLCGDLNFLVFPRLRYYPGGEGSAGKKRAL